MSNNFPTNQLEKIQQLKQELSDLEAEEIQIEGKSLKPSQCYHVELDPLHILYNTNCPDDLKERIEGILAKYVEAGEDPTQQ